jgi:hypothetical protein
MRRHTWCEEANLPPSALTLYAPTALCRWSAAHRPIAPPWPSVRHRCAEPPAPSRSPVQPCRALGNTPPGAGTADVNLRPDSRLSNRGDNPPSLACRQCTPSLYRFALRSLSWSGPFLVHRGESSYPIGHAERSEASPWQAETLGGRPLVEFILRRRRAQGDNEMKTFAQAHWCHNRYRCLLQTAWDYTAPSCTWKATRGDFWSSRFSWLESI